jgi:MFS family permease
VVGTALLALPVTRLTRARGRRPGLMLAFLLGALGAAIVVTAAQIDSVALLFVGLLLFGGGSVANLQARYTAVDLAEPARAGRQLSIVVWATTVGAVAGPNLAPLANSVLTRYDLAENVAPFVFSVLAFVVGAVVVNFLRPDPLLVSGTAEEAARTGFSAAWHVVRASPPALLGLVAMAVGHLVMVGVMAMTPVHIGQSGHGDVLRVVGVVLSLHVAGMYALSPVTGWLTDRYGARAVILGGIALLLAACAVAGTAGHDTVRLAVGLTLLGMGWSGTMVAGSTLLTRSLAAGVRPSAQGLADLMMGLAGAGAGALGGVVVAWSGYGTLALLAAIATIPLLAMALRPLGTGSSEGQ